MDMSFSFKTVSDMNEMSEMYKGDIDPSNLDDSGTQFNQSIINTVQTPKSIYGQL